MSKGKRYKLKQKRYKNFFISYIIIVILVFSNYTFSKYTQTSSSEPTPIGVANFSVKVNGKTVGIDKEFDLTLSPSNEDEKVNTSDNKLAPNTERRFDILIDLTGTEVALEYEFRFNIKDNANIVVTKYSLDDGKTFKNDVENNVIKGEILIKDSTRPFKEEETVKINAYLKWNDEEIYNPIFNDTNVMVSCIISQKIN